MRNFSLCRVHHISIQAGNVGKTRDLFATRLGFRPTFGDFVRGKCIFKILGFPGESCNSDVISECDVTNCTLTPPTDTVKDVCFVVKNIENLLTEIRERKNVAILQDLTSQKCEETGKMRKVAVIQSIVGNVTHTLIEEEESEVVQPKVPHLSKNHITEFDHITYACRIGETNRILEWYEAVFGMKRFDFGDPDGITVQTGNIGMKLNAMEYWMCAETGLCPPGPDSTSSGFPMIVVAEPLPGMDPNNQVDVFIQEHGGPGIQHIGLKTGDVCEAKEELRSKGIEFIEPPPTYYTEVGKLGDICGAGEDLEKLQKYGILIDQEETSSNCDQRQPKYLMQVFTKPIFDKRTFFLELIERRGARGFGAGNITALFKSVQAYMKQ